MSGKNQKQMTREPRNYWRFAAVLLAALLASSVAYTIAQSFETPDIYLDDLPASASYTIKTDGTYIWAVEPDGEVSISSTNASYVMQSAMDALTDGGKIFVTNGDYSLTTALTPNYNGITLEGENMQTTFLRQPIGSTNNIIERINPVTAIYFFTVRNLWIIGNDGGIGDGIHITGANTNDVHLEDIRVAYCYDGVKLMSWGAKLYGVNSEHNKHNGIEIYTSGESELVSCFSADNDNEGFSIGSSTTVMACESMSNGRYGFSLLGQRCKLIGSYSFDNFLISGGTKAEVGVEDHEQIVVGNYIDGDDTKAYGIRVGADAHDCIIENNQFYNFVTAGIWNQGGITNKIRYNVGFVTENVFSGANTTATTAVLAHGLASTATYVWCSFNSSAITGYTWTSNTTHVTITPAGTLPASWVCYVKAEYVP